MHFRFVDKLAPVIIKQSKQIIHAVLPTGCYKLNITLLILFSFNIKCNHKSMYIHYKEVLG
jgi:hypothetical protein